MVTTVQFPDVKFRVRPDDGELVLRLTYGPNKVMEFEVDETTLHVIASLLRRRMPGIWHSTWNHISIEPNVVSFAQDMPHCGLSLVVVAMTPKQKECLAQYLERAVQTVEA